MKRLFPLSVSLIAALAFGAALPLSSESSSPSTIRLGTLKGPSGIGMIYLFDEPPALPGGKKLESVAVASADLMVPKLVSGEYDMAVLPINMAAKLRKAGVPIQLAAIVGDGMVSFITSDSSVSSIADLKGKEIYVAGQGATPDYLMQKLLKSAGLDPSKDLRLSYSMPYPEMAAAIASGKIAYAVLPEPFATLALKANSKLKTPLDLGALWTKVTGQASYPMTALVVTSRLASDPAAVKAILAAVQSSIEKVKADPAAAGALVEKHDFGLKAGIAALAIPKSAYVFTKAPAARPAVEALLAAFLDLAPASVGGTLPDDGFYAAF
jgi:NitT/TauT family transport system substrate-binding protein